MERGNIACRGIIPRSPQLLEIKGFLPTCIEDSKRCSLWGQPETVSSRCHNYFFEAHKGLSGNIKVEWPKGQALKADCRMLS